MNIEEEIERVVHGGKTVAEIREEEKKARMEELFKNADTCERPSSKFDPLLEHVIGEILNRLRMAGPDLARCCNTSMREKVEHLLSEMAVKLETLDSDIRLYPEKYWEVQDCLGTCGNCANLDRSRRLEMYRGHLIEGTCPFAPPVYEGRIAENSWRGCAQWKRN